MSTYTLIHEQIEYTLVTLDDKEQKARLSLLGPTILEILQQPEYSDPVNHDTKWRPEYGSYMIEGSLTSQPTSAQEERSGELARTTLECNRLHNLHHLRL